MIAPLLLAHVVAVAPAAPGTAAPAPAAIASSSPPQLTARAIVQRYGAALAKVKEPRVVSFDYTLDQTGLRTLQQTHRVFRNGNDERDETLTVDGKRLTPPKVRIFRGRRNRYTISALAPRPSDYDFRFVGPRKNVHHFDYVFTLVPKRPRPFAITEITIDGVRFLPSAIAFATAANDGSGRIAFGRNAQWWVPYFAAARATFAASVADEKLSFYTYRFPASLPPSTFGRTRFAPLPAPAPKRTTAPISVPL